MAYASLSEVWGSDFARRLNHTDPQEKYSTLNPSRGNDISPDSYLSRSHGADLNKKRASDRSSQDRNSHRESFSDVRKNYKSEKTEFKPWGDIEDTNKITPEQYLEQALNSRQKYQPQAEDFQPTQSDIYGNFYNNDSQCKDYFYHLDTCRKCQRKLKKRVARYFKTLQRHQRNPSLPGVQGMSPSMDRELFSDFDDLDEMMTIENKQEEKKEENKNMEKMAQLGKADEVREEFTNLLDLGHDFTPGIFLILFGLFIIYSLDISRKIIGSGEIKIIK